MLPSLKTSHITVYLLVGFSVFICLISLSWYITSQHVATQMVVNESTHAATEKMHSISRLIEVARERTRLSNEMLLSDDVFEKDEMAMQIATLAGDFIQHRRQLMSRQLSEQEKSILESQLPVYPHIIENLEAVTELALEDTDAATKHAREIIFREIVPLQAKVIDGFTLMMRAIEEEVHTGAQHLLEKNKAYQKTRFVLIIAILLVSITTIIVVLRKVTHIEDKLRDLSTTDELTGISNRRFFNTKLHEAWESTSRSGKPLTLLLIDIDHFKQYNDHYGHQDGDACLIKVAYAIRSIAHRSGDIVARYGGEEFAVVFPNVSESEAWILADNMLKEVRKKNIRHDSSNVHEYVTISIGCASLFPSLEKSTDDLIRAADNALYEAKDAGRNRAAIAQFSEKNPEQHSLAL